MSDFLSPSKVDGILPNLNVKKEAVSPGTAALLMLTYSPDILEQPVLESTPVKLDEVKKRKKIMEPQSPEEKHRIVKEQEILHVRWHGDAAVWGAQKNAVMMWSYKPLGYVPV